MVWYGLVRFGMVLFGMVLFCWYSLVWGGGGNSKFIHEEISIMDYNGLSCTIIDYQRLSLTRDNCLGKYSFEK